MTVDLHNHTKLCNHATGEMREYIEAAIAKGIKHFGFSDHAPMSFDPAYRMSFSDMSKYESDVLELKDHYRDQIEVLLAYEVDYLVGHMDPRVLSADVDYLIGSVHFLDSWGFDNPEFMGKYDSLDLDELWEHYFATITAMVKSAHFDIVGHIDLLKLFKFLPKKHSLADLAYDSLVAIKDSDMTLEVNMSGLRKPIGEIYPSKQILELAYSLGVDITFGSDAHDPAQVGLYAKEVLDLATSVGYKRCALYKSRKKELIPIS